MSTPARLLRRHSSTTEYVHMWSWKSTHAGYLPGTSKEQAQHSEGNMVEIAEDKLFLENDRQDVPEAGRVLPG